MTDHSDDKQCEAKLAELVERTAPRLLVSVLKGELLTAWLELDLARSAELRSGHDWQPDGGVLRFESHHGGEAPHVHTTCAKCGARAWFLEYQWKLIATGCPTAGSPGQGRP